MALWTERLLVLAVALASGAQVGAPGELHVSGEVRRAVLLEDSDFFSAPSSDGEIAAQFPAGTVLEYVGEATDDFGRSWFTVRHPDRFERRRDDYLTNLDRRRFADLGFQAALLADRQPPLVAPRPVRPVAGAPPPPVLPAWWEPVALLLSRHNAAFGAVLAISARAPGEGALLEAIELLGGREAIAVWPADPLPGELFVPPMLPALFQFDGAEWRLARPVRLLDDSISLLGNPRFAIDPEAPTMAGGPLLHCWSLIDSLDPAGTLAGSVQVAPPVEQPRGRGGRRGGAAAVPGAAAGGQGQAPNVVPPMIGRMLAPLPPTMLVPPRVDPPAPPGGVLLEDAHSRQAVYLQQTLDAGLTERLRGMSVVLDIVARNPPRSLAAATIGVDIAVRLADGSLAEPIATSFSLTAAAARVAFPFEVPADADTITVRLLAADRSLARDQRGAVIIERASLRLATWAVEPPASSVVLYRIRANAFEGASLHTRAPIAVTARPADEIERVWPQVVAADWPSDDKQLVLAGEIRNGMSTEQVRLSWGAAAEETTSGGAVNVSSWIYEDRYAAFSDGRLIAFDPPRRQTEVAGLALMCPGDVALLPGVGR